MKNPGQLFSTLALRLPALAVVVLLFAVGPGRAQVTINLDNGNQQSFAVDDTRHFLYVAEGSNAGTKHFSVINTLTNTVVGSYSYSSSGYTSLVAATSTGAVWADQGSSAVRVITVNGAGAASLTRSDSATLATGIAAMGGNYAVSKQGTGDKLDINAVSNGAAVFSNINLGGVAGQVFADKNTNRYYARSTNNYQIINAGTGGILGTLSGFIMAVDSSASHNYVYLQDAGISTRLDQLAGSVTSNVVNSFYDFGAAFNDVAVNSVTGDIFVAQSSLNRVVQLNSSMSFVQQFSVTGPQSIAFVDGQLYVHGSGEAFLTAIAIPEPSTWSAMLGGLGLGLALWRRRRQAAC